MDAETIKKLDFSNFEGPKINTEWKPDDQDLIYTALNWLDGEGDADKDCGQQLVERLLSAWRSSLSLIYALDTQSSRTEAMRKALEEAARWLRNGDYDTRGGLSEMSRIAGVFETALGDVADYECENCIGMPEYGCYCQAHGAIAPGGPAFKALSTPNPGDAEQFKIIDEIMAWVETLPDAWRYKHSDDDAWSYCQARPTFQAGDEPTHLEPLYASSLREGEGA